MRFHLASYLAISGFVVWLSAAEPPHVPQESIDRITEAALDRWQAPGLAVVIASRDGPILVKGYGSRRCGSDDPVTPDTLFPIGSCTKAFTSTLAAVLVDDGRIAWDDPVRKHLPGFRLSNPHADGLVNLRDLLSHRTGIEGHDLLWYRAPWGQDEVIRRIAHVPLTRHFRAEYHYTSLGYIAAGKAIALRAGKPWAELLRERIADPLGMTALAFTTAEATRSADRAIGHRRGPGGVPEPIPEYELKEPNPAGSLFVTPRDLVPWLRFHLSDGLGPAGRRIVSRENLNETKSPQVVMQMDREMKDTFSATRQTCYGMGWVVYDHRGELVVAHGGKIDGFRAQVTLLPERNLGFALLNNLHDTKMNIALANTLIDQFLGFPERDWNTHFQDVEKREGEAKRAEIVARDRARNADTRPSLPLTDYVGQYTDPAYGTASVSVENGTLIWNWSSFRCPLEHFQEESFRVVDGYFADSLVEFAVSGGEVTAARTIGVVFIRHR